MFLRYGSAFSNEKQFVAKLTIKKNETKNTITTFSVADSYVAIKANLKSYSADISSILNVKPQNLGFTIQMKPKMTKLIFFFKSY